MGLLLSMTSDAVPPGFDASTLPFPDKAGQPLTVLFELEVDARIAARTLVTRSFVVPGVDAIDVRQDGLVARLYLPAIKRKAPALIVLGGSAGGLETASYLGMSLASRGYVALAVGYFRAEGLPQQLVSIPLETVQRALTYLSRRPSVDA